MKLSSTLEDYLETILLLSEGDSGVRLSDIADKVGVTKASTNRAITMLSQAGLVHYERYREIRLTPTGYAYADGILHKHKVIKQFFIDVLHVDKDVADQEACLIEHVISSNTIRSMENFLKKHNC